MPWCWEIFTYKITDIVKMYRKINCELFDLLPAAEFFNRNDLNNDLNNELKNCFILFRVS